MHRDAKASAEKYIEQPDKLVTAHIYGVLLHKTKRALCRQFDLVDNRPFYAEKSVCGTFQKISVQRKGFPKIRKALVFFGLSDWT